VVTVFNPLLVICLHMGERASTDAHIVEGKKKGKKGSQDSAIAHAMTRFRVNLQHVGGREGGHSAKGGRGENNLQLHGRGDTVALRGGRCREKVDLAICWRQCDIGEL